MSRATDLLRPPAGVTLTYHDGLLTASGAATARWITDSERMAPALAGVRRFAYADRDPEVALKQRLESTPVLFLSGTNSLAPGQAAAVRAVGDLLTELNETARARGKRIQVDVRGHTDSDGPDALNGALSDARARALLGMIATDRFDALQFAIRGAASTEPVSAGITNEEKQRNRRVSVHVLLAGAASREPARP